MSWTVSTSKQKKNLLGFLTRANPGFLFNTLGILMPFPWSWTHLSLLRAGHQQWHSGIAGSVGHSRTLTEPQVQENRSSPGDSQERFVHSQLYKQRVLLSWIQLCLFQMWLWPSALHHRSRGGCCPFPNQCPAKSSPSHPFLNNLFSELTWIWESPQGQFCQEEDMGGEEIWKKPSWCAEWGQGTSCTHLLSHCSTSNLTHDPNIISKIGLLQN